MRIPRLRREAAAYVMLRRKGYSINLLSKIFGRSTSMIHRILKRNGLTGYHISGLGLITWRVWNPYDMRKSPVSRNLNLANIGYRIHEVFENWLLWMEGEGEKPP